MKKYISILLALTILFSLSSTVFAFDINKAAATLESVGNYLYETVKEPIVGSIGGEWAVLGLARSDMDIPDEYFESYYQTVEKYLKDHPEIDYYIIIDDENIALDSQKLHFVQTNANVGFLLDDFDKAKQIAEVDIIKGDSFWDRVDIDISDETLLLKRLEAKFEYAKQNHAECLKELHRLADVMDAAERDLNRVKFKGKTCKTCRYSAVFTTSFDGWHNMCGHEEASCTCCYDHCEHYLPDNPITQFVKDNDFHISPKYYEALKTLSGDMMKFDVDASGPAIEKMKNIIKAWRNIE